MKPKHLRRRAFLAATAAAAGATVSCGTRRNPWRFLSADEAPALAAMAECIIPTDQDPGAAWAGAVTYIDRHLTGHFRRFQQHYRDGLASLEQTARMMYGQSFATLAAAQQEELLKRLEAGRAPREIWTRVAPRAFFNLVIAHTMQSYYGDPRHGGNRDAVSWRMLGVPLVPVRGRDQYEFTQPRAAARRGGRSA